MLNKDEYDVIMMDCHMPEMDGFAATRTFREKESFKGLTKTPIIAVTANAMKGERERCIASGFDDFLTKPIDKPKLQNMLLKYIDPKKYSIKK